MCHASIGRDNSPASRDAVRRQGSGCLGVTSGGKGTNAAKWQKIQEGDIALFLQKGRAVAKGTVALKVRSAKLAKSLWGVDEDGDRRSEGAYVLYPGRTGTENRIWYAHEPLPGLGAFALKPGLVEANADTIRDFLEDVAEHVSSEATRREQLSYHRFRIEEPSGEYRTRMDLPATDDRDRRLRRRPPEERP